MIKQFSQEHGLEVHKVVMEQINKLYDLYLLPDDKDQMFKNVKFIIRHHDLHALQNMVIDFQYAHFETKGGVLHYRKIPFYPSNLWEDEPLMIVPLGTFKKIAVDSGLSFL